MQSIQQENKKRPGIAVRGVGYIKASPDTAAIVLGARTEKLNLQEAQEENARRIEGIFTALISIGVSREEIQTTDYRIDTVYRYEDGNQIFSGYRVLHLLNVTVKGTERAGAIVDLAVSNGANEMAGITFSSSQSKSLYLHALSLALADARGKAETIAREIRRKLHPVPVFITEESSPPAPRPFLTASFNTGSPSTPIEPGTIQVQAEVKVLYTFF